MERHPETHEEKSVISVPHRSGESWEASDSPSEASLLQFSPQRETQPNNEHTQEPGTTTTYLSEGAQEEEKVRHASVFS